MAEADCGRRADTHLGARVGLAVDDLRRGVQGAPAERLQELAVVVEVGQPKVRNLKSRSSTGRGHAKAWNVLQLSARPSPGPRGTQALAGGWISEECLGVCRLQGPPYSPGSFVHAGPPTPGMPSSA